MFLSLFFDEVDANAVNLGFELLNAGTPSIAQFGTAHESFPDNYFSHDHAPFLAHRLTESEKITLAVTEPCGSFTNAAGRWIVAGNLGYPIDRLETRHIDLFEHHASSMQLGYHCIQIIDLPSHLGMFA
jgi:hypothetical protein